MDADGRDFDAFVAGRGTALLWFAHVLTGDERYAEESLVAALGRIRLAWHRYRDDAEAETRGAIVTCWLATVPRHEDIAAVPEPDADADESERTWQALAGLPPRHRAVLVLRYGERMGDAEIAELLRCRRVNVRELAGAALDALERVGVAPVELLAQAFDDPRRRLDPDPQLVRRTTEVADTLRGRTRRRRAIVAAAVIALITALVVVEVANYHPDARSQASSGLPPSRIHPLTVGHGAAIDVSSGLQSLYVLEVAPPALYRINPSTMKVTARVALPTSMTQSAKVTADLIGPRVWVWEPDGQAAAYDSTTLQPLFRWTVPMARGDQVNAVAANAMALWLGTNNGMYEMDEGGVRRLTGVSGSVGALAADTNRLRVVAAVANFGGTRYRGVTLLSVASTGEVTGAPGRADILDLAGSSLAVAAGTIWIAGFTINNVPTISQLDPETLRPVSGSPVGRFLGSGAVVWSGESVLWVRQAADRDLYCLDPSTGIILQRWSQVHGPVASVIDSAISVGDVNGASNSNTAQLQLDIMGCSG